MDFKTARARLQDSRAKAAEHFGVDPLFVCMDREQQQSPVTNPDGSVTLTLHWKIDYRVMDMFRQWT